MTLVFTYITVETMAVDDPPETTVNNVHASPQTESGNTYVFLYILFLSCEFLPYRQLYSYIAHTISNCTNHISII